jgi:hypothetical protein
MRTRPSSTPNPSGSLGSSWSAAHAIEMRGISPLLAAKVSSHELVKRDHDAEIDRIAKTASTNHSAEYFNYVMLPLVILVGVVIGLRKLMGL